MIKLLIIVGPTSSGKSELAVKLAKRFKGEIISCDSRQIYKHMNLGTGKVTGKWHISRFDGRQILIYKYKNIFHHLIDFQNPARQYSASHFQIAARKKIAEIIKRGKLPILCGGTMHWIDAVVYDQNIPEVKPNLKLRTRLEKQTADKLYKQLVKLDPTRANSIDKFNKRRLIRALEIVITTGKPVPFLSSKPLTLNPTLWLGITLPQTDLYKKIEKRLHERLKQGMLNEVKKLHKNGLAWKKLESFGLEYKYTSLYLQQKLSYEEMILKLSYAIKHYAKRQMTWWKRNKEIIWIKPDIKKAIKLTTKFLKP